MSTHTASSRESSRESLWPPFGLRLTIGDVELRPLCESDALELAAGQAEDLELDPAAYRLPGDDDRHGAQMVTLQAYWRAWAGWQVDAWRLGFGVRERGDLVGFQELEGNDFPRLRTVDSSSFLRVDARGRGVGRAMRTAVLALAFGPLGALAAVTEAWHDNHASLHVSRALGYLPNGEAMQARGDGAETMMHLRLMREDWQASGRETSVTIEGFDPCRPYFGLAASRRA